MAVADIELPRLIATSVVRGAQQGDSHGGIYLVDFQAENVTQVVDWNTSEIDFQGRGWDRGLRGIAFHGGEIYIAASDELFVYNQAFEVQRSFRCTYLKHCHEIYRLNNHLYLTSTGHDSILAFDLEKQDFFWAIYLGRDEDGEAMGTAYNPKGINGPGGANGPPATNRLHLNSVYADRSGLYTSGLRSQGLFRIGVGNTVQQAIDMPQGMHNARPWRDGVLFNDTASDLVRYVSRDGSQVAIPVPRYEESELEHGELGSETARQGFGRGLCVINERLIAAGSSPSTVTVYDMEAGVEVTRVNFSMDIRNAIHGLEVWPYD